MLMPGRKDAKKARHIATLLMMKTIIKGGIIMVKPNNNQQIGLQGCKNTEGIIPLILCI